MYPGDMLSSVNIYIVIYPIFMGVRCVGRAGGVGLLKCLRKLEQIGIIILPVVEHLIFVGAG